MTYFAFLALFLGIPIALLSLWTIVDYQRGRWLPRSLSQYPAWAVMLGLCLVALVYTTPWDNYLVATGVWWYNPDLVNGLVIGWVPIEEYTFFLVLPIMTSLWLLVLFRYLPINPRPANSVRVRVIATSVTFVLWMVSNVLLALSFISPEWKPFTYLGLQLSWALIPVMIQFAFGADILWRHRNLVLLAIVSATAYLSWADAIAIDSGTWTIDPAQSLVNFKIAGVLPIEELLFFLMVNILVVLGMTLVLSEESSERAVSLLERYRATRRLAGWLRPKMIRVDGEMVKG